MHTKWGQESDPSFLLSFSAPLIFVRNNMQLLQENLSFANVQEVKALSGDLFNHKCSTVFSLTERKKTMSLLGFTGASTVQLF